MAIANAPSTESVATSAETTTSPDAAAPAAAAEGTPEKSRLASEFEQAMNDAGLAPRGAAGMVKLDKGKPKTSPDAPTPIPARVDAKPKTTDEKQGEVDQKPTDAQKPPTQSSLSAGYAKLNRLTKAAERREAELKAREDATKAEADKAKAERDAIAKEREAWQSEQKAKLDELALLDADELSFLDKYAARKGTTPQAVYDKWMRKVLNGGTVDPVDAAAEVKEELNKVKAQLETGQADLKKREDEAKAEKEKADASAKLEEQKSREKTQFGTWVTEQAETFPTLSKEDAAEASELAHQVGSSFFRQYRQGATFEDVALALEYTIHSGKQRTVDQIAALIAAGVPRQWREEQVAKPKAEEPVVKAKPAPAPVAKAAPKAVAKPAEPQATSAQDTGAEEANPEPRQQVTPNGLIRRSAAEPKTLTHSLAVQRTGSRANAPRDDNERLDRALSHWT